MSIYDTYIAEFVIREIAQTADEDKRDRLMNVIGEYPITVFNLEDIEEVEFLADKYLSSGILPQKNLYDALHVTCCVVRKVDYLVSWNYKHLANINKGRKFIAKNYELGYLHPLRIVTPTQLIGCGT